MGKILTVRVTIYFLILVVSLSLLALVNIAPTASNSLIDTIGRFLKSFDIIILLLGLSNAFLALLVYRLWIWRNVISDGKENLIPEKWISNLNENYRSLGKAIQSWSQFSKSNYSKIKELSEITDTLNSILDEKEEELARHRTGFDTHLYKNFLAKFSAIHATAQKAVNTNDNKDLEEIVWKLEDALEDCGVSIEFVREGDDFSTSGDLCSDNPKIIPNNDPEKNLKIAHISRQAYALNSPGGKRIILPAKVAVYEEAKVRSG